MALSSTFSSNFCLKSHHSQSHSVIVNNAKAGLPLKPRTKVFMSRNAQLFVDQTQMTLTEVPQRGMGTHHPNLWDVDFIQPHHYQAPQYTERCGRLISEIKQLFSSEKDVPQLLSLVDNIERLGIDRHFQEEIKAALDLVYMNWGECSERDMNTTALGFRILRLHRYSVSPGVFGAFRTENAHFFPSTPISEEEEIRSVVNLYRASCIAFPGEKILDEAKHFSTQYLREALHKTGIDSSLSHEISFALENSGGLTNFPRLEAKKYIEIYEENCPWLWTKDSGKLLSLAQMDFKMIQSMYQQELELYSRWWRDSGLSQIKFASRPYIEYFYLACTICEDEKYSVFRSSIAKLSAIAAYFADTYQIYGTLDQLQHFTNAIKRWDPTSMEALPKYMKIMYNVLDETLNEIDQEAQKMQGQNSQSTSRNIWQSYVESMMQEAKWHALKNLPTLVQYIQNEKVGFRAWESILNLLLRVNGIILENITQKHDYPSRVNDLLYLCLTLKGDIKSFKGKTNQGEPISSISSYMRDNPGTTKEDALSYVKTLLDVNLKELNWELLNLDNIPTCTSNYTYGIIRSFLHFHQERDNFTLSSKDIKDHVSQILFEPMKLKF